MSTSNSEILNQFKTPSLSDTPPNKPKPKGVQYENRTAHLPWRRDPKGFQFLNIEPICRPSDMGLTQFDYGLSAWRHTIIAMTDTAAILFNTNRRSVREIQVGKASKKKQCDYSLSPDGKTLIRCQSGGGSCVIEAILTKTNKPLAHLPGQNQCEKGELYLARWSGNSVIYIPDAKQGTITRWSFESDPASCSLIRPLSGVTNHEELRIHLAKDQRWLIISGQPPFYEEHSPAGLIQIHDIENNESRVVSGRACRVAEVDVYDKKTTLLFVSDVTKAKLTLDIQQLDVDAPGEPFQSISVSVDVIAIGDSPLTIRVLEGLPIVAISSTQSSLYFFEIHSGAYLFSKNLEADKAIIWNNSDDESSFLLDYDGDDTIHQ